MATAIPARSPGLPTVLALLGLILVAGCARERREITPTTLGTDLGRMPRGKMTPPPWPGQDIVKASPSPEARTSDPEASMASGSVEAR